MGSLQCSSIDAALAEKSKHSIVRLEAEQWDGLAGFTLDCGSTYRHLLGPALGEFIDRDADRARNGAGSAGRLPGLRRDVSPTFVEGKPIEHAFCGF